MFCYILYTITLLFTATQLNIYYLPTCSDKCCISAVPDRSSRPYSIGCFRGCPYRQPIQRNGEPVADLRAYDACQLSGAPGTTADYQPTMSAYASTVNTASNIITSVGASITTTTTTAVDPALSSTGTYILTHISLYSTVYYYTFINIYRLHFFGTDSILLQANTRKVASQSAFDGMLSVLTFTDTVQDNIHDANLSNNMSVVDQEILERSTTDVVMTGMHVENSTSKMIYYATEFGIFSYDQVSKSKIFVSSSVLYCIII